MKKTPAVAALLTSAALLAGCSAQPADHTVATAPPVQAVQSAASVPTVTGRGVYVAESDGVTYRIHLPGELSAQGQEAARLAGVILPGVITVDVDNSAGKSDVSLYSIGVVDDTGTASAFTNVGEIIVLSGSMGETPADRDKIYGYANDHTTVVPATAKATLEYGSAKVQVPELFRRVYFVVAGKTVEAKKES